MSSLSIILPTFNEVKSIGHVLNVWHNYLEKLKIKHEFVICEDGSTDGTKELILKLLRTLISNINLIIILRQLKLH